MRNTDGRQWACRETVHGRRISARHLPRRTRPYPIGSFSMRITSVVCASALVLASLLGACGQRDSSAPAGGAGTSPSGGTATTPSPTMPPASAASR